ncbi:MAG: hypothetical protein PHS93_08515 [Candidatus Omnitrophica bacterium]|jgi:hypothetical protein|nr:hypothetical protein [Candidatus Neomarinimicrobiota bacterium]MDD5353186.1 hypothetical protein [Candidatus Omnitrophota bacterium]
MIPKLVTLEGEQFDPSLFYRPESLGVVGTVTAVTTAGAAAAKGLYELWDKIKAPVKVSTGKVTGETARKLRLLLVEKAEKEGRITALQAAEMRSKILNDPSIVEAFKNAENQRVQLETASTQEPIVPGLKPEHVLFAGGIVVLAIVGLKMSNKR